MMKDKQFFDDDIEPNLETINHLFSLVRNALESQAREDGKLGNTWDKDIVIDLYRGCAEFGIYDKILKQLNNLYMPFENYNSIGANNPFRLNATFIDNFYTSLCDKREIATSGMFLGNRLAKISGKLIESCGWSNQYILKLNSMYNEYLTKETSFDFIEGTIIEDNNNHLKIDSNNDRKEYLRFMMWLKKHGKSNPQQLLKDFYIFSKLKYCESFFYQMKNENLSEIILMQERNELGISVWNATEVDDMVIPDKTNRENTILLRIDIPGYNEPYLIHTKKSEINKILGRETNATITLPITLDKGEGHPFLNYRLTNEQIEFLQSRVPKTILGQKRFDAIVESMRTSIIMQERYQAELLRKYRKEEVDKQDGDRVKEDKEKTSRVRKSSLMEDKPFTDEICESIERSLGVHIPEEYKYSSGSKSCLMYKSEKQKMKFSGMYKYMRNFLQTKLSKEGQDVPDKVLTDEANKMYIYMKLCGKGFWNLSYSDKRPIILEEAYKEYASKFSTICTAIQEGVSVEGLKDYVKSHTSPNIKGGVSKKSKNLKGKRGTAKKLSNQKRKKEQAFSSVGDNKDKDLQNELIKQALIVSIETKKSQLELKRQELALLEKELERLEKLKKSIEENSIGDDD